MPNTFPFDEGFTLVYVTNIVDSSTMAGYTLSTQSKTCNMISLKCNGTTANPYAFDLKFFVTLSKNSKTITTVTVSAKCNCIDFQFHFRDIFPFCTPSRARTLWNEFVFWNRFPFFRFFYYVFTICFHHISIWNRIFALRWPFELCFVCELWTWTWLMVQRQ